jgi:inner membrane protein
LDLVTQGVLGATLALSAAPQKEARLAAAVGFGAGLLADADILIGSSADPLLALEYHRHFTHALAFVPIGALIAAGLLWPLLRKRIGFRRLYLYCFLGYAFSGLLDACTSYGTHLFWPFSDQRVAWSIIAIVDPLFTLLLGVPLALGVIRQRAWAAQAGLALAACYLVLGLLQQGRAESAAQALAAERGHRPERMLVKPTIGNLVLWRSIYVVNGRAYADGIRVGTGAAKIYPGTSVALLDVKRDLPSVPSGSKAAADTARFVAFSDGYAALHPARPDFVGDARYAMLPDSVEPLWGIRLEGVAPDIAVYFVTDRALTPSMRRRFIRMLLGEDAA